MTDRAAEIMEILSDNVQDIFIQKQNELGINSGDISFELEYDLTFTLEKLSTIIDLALTAQENG